MENLQQIASQIISITTQIVGSFGPLVGYTKLIIGFGALVIIILKTSSMLATGQSIKDNLPALTKPLFLLALVIFYSAIISLINLMLSPIASGTDGMAQALMVTNENMETKFYTDLDRIYGVVKNTNDQAATDAKSDDTTFGVSFDAVIKSLSDFSRYFSLPYILGMLLSMLQIIFNFILKISFLGILLLRSINLAILIIFGPVAIALSVWSPLADNWKAWVVNYVGKYMWLPVAQVTLTACYTLKNLADQKAYETILKIAAYSQAYGGGVNGNVTGLVTVGVTDYVPVLMSIGLTVIGIVAITQVPAFTNLIISNSAQGMTNLPSPGYASTRAAGNILSAPVAATRSVMRTILK